MFGFSLQKLIFTVLAIAAVVYGFRWLTAMQHRRDAMARNRPARSRKSSNTSPASQSSPSVDDAELMIECTVCGSYVSASDTRSCGRNDCPYPG